MSVSQERITNALDAYHNKVDPDGAFAGDIVRAILEADDRLHVQTTQHGGLGLFESTIIVNSGRATVRAPSKQILDEIRERLGDSSPKELPSDYEPNLADGVSFGPGNFCDGAYYRGNGVNRASTPVIDDRTLTIEQLESVCRHMRWRKSNQERAAEVTITDDMVLAAWEKMIPHNPVQPSKAQVREALQAALAIASKETK